MLRIVVIFGVQLLVINNIILLTNLEAAQNVVKIGMALIGTLSFLTTKTKDLTEADQKCLNKFKSQGCLIHRKINFVTTKFSEEQQNKYRFVLESLSKFPKNYDKPIDVDNTFDLRRRSIYDHKSLKKSLKTYCSTLSALITNFSLDDNPKIYLEEVYSIPMMTIINKCSSLFPSFEPIFRKFKDIVTKNYTEPIYMNVVSDSLKDNIPDLKQRIGTHQKCKEHEQLLTNINSILVGENENDDYLDIPLIKNCYRQCPSLKKKFPELIDIIENRNRLKIYEFYADMAIKDFLKFDQDENHVFDHISGNVLSDFFEKQNSTKNIAGSRQDYIRDLKFDKTSRCQFFEDLLSIKYTDYSEKKQQKIIDLFFWGHFVCPSLKLKLSKLKETINTKINEQKLNKKGVNVNKEIEIDQYEDIMYDQIYKISPSFNVCENIYETNLAENIISTQKHSNSSFCDIKKDRKTCVQQPTESKEFAGPESLKTNRFASISAKSHFVLLMSKTTTKEEKTKNNNMYQFLCLILLIIFLALMYLKNKHSHVDKSKIFKTNKTIENEKADEKPIQLGNKEVFDEERQEKRKVAKEKLIHNNQKINDEYLDRKQIKSVEETIKVNPRRNLAPKMKKNRFNSDGENKTKCQQKLQFHSTSDKLFKSISIKRKVAKEKLIHNNQKINDEYLDGKQIKSVEETIKVNPRRNLAPKMKKNRFNSDGENKTKCQQKLQFHSTSDKLFKSISIKRKVDNKNAINTGEKNQQKQEFGNKKQNKEQKRQTNYNAVKSNEEIQANNISTDIKINRNEFKGNQINKSLELTNQYKHGAKISYNKKKSFLLILFIIIVVFYYFLGDKLEYFLIYSNTPIISQEGNKVNNEIIYENLKNDDDNETPIISQEGNKVNNYIIYEILKNNEPDIVSIKFKTHDNDDETLMISQKGNKVNNDIIYENLKNDDDNETPIISQEGNKISKEIIYEFLKKNEKYCLFKKVKIINNIHQKNISIIKSYRSGNSEPPYDLNMHQNGIHIKKPGVENDYCFASSPTNPPDKPKKFKLRSKFAKIEYTYHIVGPERIC